MAATSVDICSILAAAVFVDFESKSILEMRTSFLSSALCSNIASVSWMLQAAQNLHCIFLRPDNYCQLFKYLCHLWCRALWCQAHNQRKKFYNNFVKNYRKHNLHKDLMATSPDFLPLKYKPKRIPGEIASHTTAKIMEAKQPYSNEVNLMLGYSKVHQTKVTAVDEGIGQLIKDS